MTDYRKAWLADQQVIRDLEADLLASREREVRGRELLAAAEEYACAVEACRLHDGPPILHLSKRLEAARTRLHIAALDAALSQQPDQLSVGWRVCPDCRKEPS